MITPLKTVKNQPNIAVIKILTDLLTDAVEGNIQGIAIAGATGNGETFNVFDGGNEVMLLSAEIGILSRDFIDCNVSLRCPTNSEA